MNVRQKGMQWLREKLGHERLPRVGRPVKPAPDLKASDLEDYWTTALPDLRVLYGGICAYAGIEIREGGETVDHFESKARCLGDPARHHLIYDWTNYRYAFARINSAKGESVVLDPFMIHPDWFALEFVGLMVVPFERLAEEVRRGVRASIQDLGLNRPWLVNLRVEYFESWFHGEIQMSYLRRHAPFVAHEIERQRLVPDVAPA